jgi:adenylyltransferase/sulfurtransferase
MHRYLIIGLLALLLVACGPATTAQEAAPVQEAAPAQEAPAPADVPVSPNISPQELSQALQQADRPFLLDVREPYEAQAASIPGTSALIPLGSLSTRVNELSPDAEIVVYCRSGNRSQQAMSILQNAGFTNVRNLSGGIQRWASQGGPITLQ